MTPERGIIVSTRREWGAAASGKKLAVCLVLALCGCSPAHAQSDTGPIVVVETTKGVFAFETYPEEAPKTVAHILELVKQGFYDGQRLHRAVAGFVVQWGDPRSRDLGQESEWGLGPAASSGHRIGVSEITKKRSHTAGAVAVAHPGLPADADSQIYVTLANRPDLNGKYAVFGHIVEGGDVPSQLQRGDVIVKMFVRDPSPPSRLLPQAPH